LLRGGVDPAPGEKRPYAIKRRGTTMRMRTKTVEMKKKTTDRGSGGQPDRNSVTPL
jgi:hypothetical protein